MPTASKNRANCDALLKRAKISVATSNEMRSLTTEA